MRGRTTIGPPAAPHPRRDPAPCPRGVPAVQFRPRPRDEEKHPANWRRPSTGKNGGDQGLLAHRVDPCSEEEVRHKENKESAFSITYDGEKTPHGAG
jgi:hypothetical protein